MRWSIGSRWLRWDPHIHAPGTLKENHYGDHTDPAVWDRYFATIREAQPSCAAIGITDYFVPRGYRLFIEHGGREKLMGIFAFPNIELRLKTRTERGNAPNVHLLISPEPEDHLAVITSKLAGLTFTYGEEYRCTEDDLRRLGRAVQRDASLNDEAALRAGAAQFLVDYDHFAKLKNDPWIRQHVLFAVAAGNDGLGGLKADGQFKAHREELGRIGDHLESRRADRETIRRMTEAIAIENSKKRSIPTFKTASEEATRARTAIEQELKLLPASAPKEHVKAYEDAVAAHKALQDAIQQQASASSTSHDCDFMPRDGMRRALLDHVSGENAVFAEDVTDAELICGFEVIDTPNGKRVVRRLSQGLRAIKVKRPGGVEYVICDASDHELYQPAGTLEELRARFART